MLRDFPRSRSIATRALRALAVVTCVLATAREPAHADCATPPPKVLWSYPADGDRDVPVDAVFWIVSNAWGVQPEATLNGKPLDNVEWGGAFDSLKIDPGALEPDTDYALRYAYARSGDELDAGDSPGFDIAFRTGSGHAQAPAAPEISGHHSSSGIDPKHRCTDVIEAQDCFDTGQDTLFEFGASGSDAIAWFVERKGVGSTLWPKRCGDPALFAYGDIDFGCVDIRALGAGGKLSANTAYCIPDGVARDGGARDGGDPRSPGPTGRADDAGTKPNRTHTGADDGGCSVSTSGTGAAQAWWWPLLALSAIALRARRTR